jgi:hypothetical protein
MYAPFVRFALAIVILVLGLCPTLARAQSVGPLPPVVVDLHGFWSGLGQDPVTADNLDVPASDLPSRGFGLLGGVHGYPIRRGRFAIGIGGELIVARGRAQQEDDEGQPVGEPVQQRLRGLSGNLSLNFGDRNGWSYVTAGIGPMAFTTFLGESTPEGAVPSKSTINLGGGARWFASRHVAISFDVRFYLTRPLEIVPPFPGRQRSRLTILSAGVSIQ